jgi:hypothetical protein
MASDWISRLAAAALVSTLFGTAAGAGETVKPTGVVELFTSQGCSSCPPADALFGELVAKGDVVALAYHVDYWDYLGWRDTLGSPDNTARQYDYGKAFGLGSVYTPQAVINGRVHVNGSSRSAVTGALDGLAKSGEGLKVPLSASQMGDSIMIDAGAATGAENSAHVVLVYFDEQKPVVIERGENGGTTVTYWNAVSKVQTAGMWHGTAQRFELPASEIAKKDGCAVLLQSVDKNGLPGAILGATVIRRPDAMPK